MPEDDLSPDLCDTAADNCDDHINLTIAQC